MTYRDDFIISLKRNLSSITGFWFDCVTSIPWSYMDLHFYLACIAEQGAVVPTNSNARVIRVVKILRILRVIRILKLVKFVTIIQDYAVLYFGSAIFKIGRLLIIAMLGVHIFACIYYRIKRDTTPNSDDVEAFYQSKYVDQDDLPRAYLVCFYYVLTTFTTVGYGDIYAASDGERVFCIFLFLCAASLFGTIISQVNKIVNQKTSVSKELDVILESYLIVKPRLEIKTMFKIKEWERYRFMMDYEHKQHQKILERKLPDTLKLSIAKKIENNLFLKVPFLTGMNSINEIRTMFAAELILKSKTIYFAQGSIIADRKETAQGLMVITYGFVNVELPMDSEEADEENQADNGTTHLYVFSRGDSVGGNAVVGDKRWTGSLGVYVDLVARTHCSVALIPTQHILDIMEKFEFLPIKCRTERARLLYRKHKEGADHSLYVGPAKKPLNSKSSSLSYSPEAKMNWIHLGPRSQRRKMIKSRKFSTSLIQMGVVQWIAKSWLLPCVHLDCRMASTITRNFQMRYCFAR
uniref:Ion transport domain-containing protein n=1 Tax=Cryptomonas curvata TaxID=233186 RepID=A0A7S0MT42_9CRYP|mmetsp:Transcript_53367/g.111381  ORF Transcript_53367/g.111381 Transcript_53367/m.111381 type:complete len:523 (+) Transcript_53367:2557-4125(+)